MPYNFYNNICSSKFSEELTLRIKF